MLRYNGGAACTTIVFSSIVVTSLLSSSEMVAPSDDDPGHWKYFSIQSTPSINIQGADKYFRPDSSPNRVSAVLLGQVLSCVCWSSWALSVRFWGFPFKSFFNSLTASYASTWSSTAKVIARRHQWCFLAIPLAVVTPFSNYFLLIFSIFPDRWWNLIWSRFWGFSKFSLWIRLSSSTRWRLSAAITGY